MTTFCFITTLSTVNPQKRRNSSSLSLRKFMKFKYHEFITLANL